MKTYCVNYRYCAPAAGFGNRREHWTIIEAASPNAARNRIERPFRRVTSVTQITIEN